jgi:hypothetical protein
VCIYASVLKVRFQNCRLLQESQMSLNYGYLNSIRKKLRLSKVLILINVSPLLEASELL